VPRACDEIGEGDRGDDDGIVNGVRLAGVGLGVRDRRCVEAPREGVDDRGADGVVRGVATDGAVRVEDQRVVTEVADVAVRAGERRERVFVPHVAVEGADVARLGDDDEARQSALGGGAR